MVTLIWILLVVLAIWFGIVFTKDLLVNKQQLETLSWVKTGIIGFVVNFFDVLGIGAFAPQTALLKFTKQTEDKMIPGTMNVANTLPVLIQAIVFIQIVEVEPITLIVMFATAAAGAIWGASVVSRLSEQKIRMVMSMALLVAAGFMLAKNMHWIQGEGNANGLTGLKLLIAGLVNFLLGALMTVGVGLYAPCMALVFALGMSPQVAFPIMMGSCAFLMPPASVKFIKEGAYNRKAAVVMAVPGMLAVLLAVFVVKSMPLDTLRWVVMLVIVYTSYNLFRTAVKK